MSEAFRSDRTPLVTSEAFELLPPDLTAIFGSALTLGAAQKALSDVGQWLAIDGDASQSIGDLILSNSTGPLRLGFGAWRDILLGVQFFNGRGELISAGGKTMKNVAGYDVTKFIVGSAGMLGQVVSTTVRTYKMPSGAIVARHRSDASIFSRLISTPLRPQWAVLTSEDLFCGYLGDERTIDYLMANLPKSEPIEITRRSVADDIAHRQQLWRAAGPIEFRASVPPPRVGEAADAVQSGHWAADPAFGIVIGAVDSESELPGLSRWIKHVGGNIRWTRTGEAAPADQAGADTSVATVDFAVNSLEREIIERLKAAFDPDHKLAPLPWATA